MYSILFVLPSVRARMLIEPRDIIMIITVRDTVPMMLVIDER